jgi:hypothetical protein
MAHLNREVTVFSFFEKWIMRVQIGKESKLKKKKTEISAEGSAEFDSTMSFEQRLFAGKKMRKVRSRYVNS